MQSRSDSIVYCSLSFCGCTTFLRRSFPDLHLVRTDSRERRELRRRLIDMLRLRNFVRMWTNWDKLISAMTLLALKQPMISTRRLPALFTTSSAKIWVTLVTLGSLGHKQTHGILLHLRVLLNELQDRRVTVTCSFQRYVTTQPPSLISWGRKFDYGVLLD